MITGFWQFQEIPYLQRNSNLSNLEILTRFGGFFICRDLLNSHIRKPGRAINNSTIPVL